MGGGGSDTQSTANAEYPPEFRPLAIGAVNQILGAQASNPLQQYTAANPQAVANLSAYQRATMEQLPNLFNNSWGLQQMQNMTPAYNTVSRNAASIANSGNSTYNSALQALASGGFGAGKQAFPNGVQAPNYRMQAGVVNGAPTNDTVLGPNTSGSVQQMKNQVAGTVPRTAVLQTAPTGPGYYLGDFMNLVNGQQGTPSAFSQGAVAPPAPSNTTSQYINNAYNQSAATTAAAQPQPVWNLSGIPLFGPPQ